CIVPSDWEAQHLHKPNNPKTVEDLKAALDCVVIKQGVFNLVFHPHGWIQNTQIVELIDHAVAKHGKKVKFLNFREALERLNKNLLGGSSLRADDGRANPDFSLNFNLSEFVKKMNEHLKILEAAEGPIAQGAGIPAPRDAKTDAGNRVEFPPGARFFDDQG